MYIFVFFTCLLEDLCSDLVHCFVNSKGNLKVTVEWCRRETMSGWLGMFPVDVIWKLPCRTLCNNSSLQTKHCPSTWQAISSLLKVWVYSRDSYKPYHRPNKVCHHENAARLLVTMNSQIAHVFVRTCSMQIRGVPGWVCFCEAV